VSSVRTIEKQLGLSIEEERYLRGDHSDVKARRNLKPGEILEVDRGNENGNNILGEQIYAPEESVIVSSAHTKEKQPCLRIEEERLTYLLGDHGSANVTNYVQRHVTNSNVKAARNLKPSEILEMDRCRHIEV